MTEESEEEYEKERKAQLREELMKEWEESHWIDKLEEEIDLNPVGAGEAKKVVIPWLPDRTPQKAADLVTKVFPDQRWLVEGILANEGVALIAAESGTYKTWLCLYLAQCVAIGAEWLRYKTHKGKVLYLNGELPEREVQRRILRLGYTEETPGAEVHFIHGTWQLDQQDDFTELVELVLQEKYDLIIGDTLSKMHSGRAEENDNDAMTDLMIKCRQVAYASDGVFLLAHHVSKPPGFPLSLLHRIRGASAIRDNAGSALLLQLQGKGADQHIHMSNPKNWYGPEMPSIKANLEDTDADYSSFTWRDAPSIDADETVKDEILDRLSDMFDLGQVGFSMTTFRGGLSSAAQKVVAEVLEGLEMDERLRIEQTWRKKLVFPGPRWDFE